VVFAYADGSYSLDSCLISRPVTIWLEATLPTGSGGVTVGEVKIVGASKVRMKKSPAILTEVDVLDEKAGYAEFRGARFNNLFIYEGSGWGHLQEAGVEDGVTYSVGANVRLTFALTK
jgi:hypothetical protein